MPYDRTIPRTCEQCGDPFLANPQSVQKGMGRYCSLACHHAHRRDHWRDNFWRHVQKSDGCWLWIAHTNAGGYGEFRRHGRTEIASRVSWEIHNGPIPDGLFVLHNCPGGDNPACVNPAHLFLGTNDDNMRDMVTKGRQVRGTTHFTRTMPDRIARGEACRTAVLTAEGVREIRQKLASGEDYRTVAATFGVSRSAIQAIIHGRSWKHVS